MSGCAGRAFDGDFNGGSVDCSGNQDNRTGISDAQGEKQQKKRGFSNGACKVKKATSFSFRKLQRFFTRSSSSSSPSSRSVSHKNSSLSSRKSGFSTGLCCCLCRSSPQMLVKNPNGCSTAPSVSSYGNLRSLIEGNDFYFNGYNTHLGN